jgi:hypothetical protein
MDQLRLHGFDHIVVASDIEQLRSLVERSRKRSPSRRVVETIRHNGRVICRGLRNGRRDREGARSAGYTIAGLVAARIIWAWSVRTMRASRIYTNGPKD